MTLAPLANPTQTELTQQVYVRRALDGYLPVDGSSDGWSYEPTLRCDWVRPETGPRMGSAEFSVIPGDSADASVAFEEILANYTGDDQVRVVVNPYDDPLVEPEDIVLFEGRLVRPRLAAKGNSVQNDERVKFTAQPLAVLDNRRTEHQVLGRWVAYSATQAELLDGYALPAAFNFRGRPNYAPTTAVAATWGGPGGFNFGVFTTDDDPDGLYWNVAGAILSLLGQWLVGGNAPFSPYAPLALSRVTDIEADTLTALTDTSGDTRADRWVGLDDRLPEVNVHGLGVFDALQAICDASGFAFACEPTPGIAPGSEAGGRPYTLRLWRKNSGEIVYPKLAPRNTTFTSGEAALRQSDTNVVVGMRDAAAIVNEVRAVGRSYFELSAILTPLWWDTDVDDATIDASLQVATETNLAGTEYHAKHVAGGVLFDQYGHVGRHWGAAHHANTPGYGAGSAYEQSADGMDWVTALGLNDATSPVRLAREALGITKPIHWTRRLRPALPCRNATAIARGQDYVLLVSEDGQSTWELMPWRFKTLRDFFGIDLTGIPNLATVNLEFFRTGIVPAIADSWWKLIDTENLFFRLTAAIEGDHGVRFDAVRQATSGSSYQLGQVMLTRDEERWEHSSSQFVESGGPTWRRVAGYEHNDADTTQASIRSAAERRRDALEAGTFTATLSTWIVTPGSYQLGDQVGGIRGREYSFAVSAGGGVYRYPNIVGITYRLTPGAQAVELSLDDHRLAAGR